MKKFLPFIVVLGIIGFVLNSPVCGQKKSKKMHHDPHETIDVRIVTGIPEILSESSGIAVSHANSIWSHNDAGNTNELFCFDTTGTIVRSLLILNATNVDWEDLTFDDQGRLYINDAGNNLNDRTDLKIYRIPDPETIVGTVAEAEIIEFIFEDQYQFPPPEPNLNFDIEAILWHTDSLYLFTKNRSNPQNGICKMYRLPALPGSHIARLTGSLFLGKSNKEARVTSADINFETGEVLLLTNSKVVSLINYPFNNFFGGEIREFYFSDRLGQVEGVDFVDNNTLYLTEEASKKSAGFLYEVHWQPASSVNHLQPTDLMIYPNPFTCQLKIDSVFGSELEVDIWDIQGKFIEPLERTGNTFSLEHLKPGVYFVRVKLGNQSIVRRVVKY
ncbi:MAG TPA: T9SS type A sorting domain-containing protein [Bacteroidales bacterium]|nr:T9SS type A sorting domain-containing protein [Bacteroidales bacterium]HPR57643.1 T9SS type A sorting domain-containing protein [Bacteroidales bacterium]HRW97402.1 T9SS type A sorting domain-containing protein [Bacteroidales bacterium]